MRYAWLCLLSLVFACSPRYVEITIEGLPDKTAKVMVTRAVNGITRGSPNLLLAEDCDLSKRSCQYSARVPDDVHGIYTLTAFALNTDDCNEALGSGLVNLSAPVVDTIARVNLALDATKKSCPLVIENRGSNEPVYDLVRYSVPLNTSSTLCKKIQRCLVSSHAHQQEPDDSVCSAACGCDEECQSGINPQVDVQLTIINPKYIWEECPNQGPDGQPSICKVTMNRKVVVRLGHRL